MRPGRTRLWYATLELPTGRAFAAATDAGVTMLALHGSRSSFLGELEAEFGQRPVQDDGPFARLEKELGEYFAGGRKGFTVGLDVGGTAFQKEVWARLLEIPFGEITTYGRLALAIGRPDAARAVGGALNRNRVPIIIPCHRVVAAGGGLGGYGGGLRLKRMLLEVEGVRPPYELAQ